MIRSGKLFHISGSNDISVWGAILIQIFRTFNLLPTPIRFQMYSIVWKYYSVSSQLLAAVISTL